jgi:4-alpha-glucanotransferase
MSFKGFTLKFERSSGILLHPTSLPSKFGIGSIGSEAFEFIDFLERAGQKLWQICPIGPTGYGNSPYQSFSAFAGNPYLISLEKLRDAGLLDDSDLETELTFDENNVEYERAIKFRLPKLRKAVLNFIDTVDGPKTKEAERFFESNSFWLEDYSCFMALKENFKGRPWYEWPEEIRIRNEETLSAYKQELSNEIEFYKYTQFIFYSQWNQLKNYANSRGVSIIGDIPIFVAMDSSDTWSNPSLFLFDDNLNPTSVAGVPPDYFSETGQLWGNPLYDWEKHKESGFSWWIDVIRAKLHSFDIFRIDHFRGFAAYWKVPYGEETAINGEWVDAPGKELFATIEKSLGDLPIIAEDLGFITKDVVELREFCKFPGMKVLQFVFESDEKCLMDESLSIENTVMYTGTHDNDTVKGWFAKANPTDKDFVLKKLNAEPETIAEAFVKEAWLSGAVIAIAPLQDVLGLGTEARMNIPGTIDNNWRWRVNSSLMNNNIENKLKELTRKSSR